MVRELIVLVHTPAAGPAAFTAVLDARVTIAPWRTVVVPAGAPLPERPEEAAGILVLGGTQSAVGPELTTWMAAEVSLLADAVAAAVPVFGVCLGAQLLGRALGGEVTRRPVPEVGYLALHRTPAGGEHPVAAGWPDGAVTMFAHEDEVTALPPGAEPLLTGSDGVAAWSLGSALAVQFHPEVDAECLSGWLDAGLISGLLERAGVDPVAFREEAERRERFTIPIGRAFLGRWLDGPVRARAGSPA
jgi:GMP synthase (glutamine-hydrolysing)